MRMPFLFFKNKYTIVYMNEWPPQEKVLKEMVQIESKSLVSADFINEYAIVQSMIEPILSGEYDVTSEQDSQDLKHSLDFISEKARTGLRTYEERFPSSEYSSPVTEANELMVAEIDKRMSLIKNLLQKEWTIESIENDREKLAEARDIMNEITAIIQNGIPYQDMAL